jgi:hypothetical protein
VLADQRRERVAGVVQPNWAVGYVFLGPFRNSTDSGEWITIAAGRALPISLPQLALQEPGVGGFRYLSRVPELLGMPVYQQLSGRLGCVRSV